MQPYLFPYIGYFQLLNAVDTFVVLDNVNFIKKGWINRNRILTKNGITPINLPVKKMSQNRQIMQHYFHELNSNFTKLMSTCTTSYSKNPYLGNLVNVLNEHISINETQVASFLTYSLQVLTKQLNINTKIIRASELKINDNALGQDRIISICKILKANQYINLSGGTELYDSKSFREADIELKFLSSNLNPYNQYQYEKFTPYMSILDLIANCTEKEIKHQLQDLSLDVFVPTRSAKRVPQS